MTNIRKASNKDLQKITKLNSLLRRNINGFKWDKKEWIEKEISSGNFHILETNNNAVGTINFRAIKEDNEVYIETIAIDPNYQKQGLSRKLIEFAINFANKMGLQKVTIDSFCSYNLEKYYSHLGFTRIATLVDHESGEKFWRFEQNLASQGEALRS